MEASIHVWSLGKWLGFLCRLFVAIFRKKAESRSDESVQAEQTAERLLTWLRQKKGIRLEAPELSRTQIKEQEYDRLADLLRRSVDMEAIYMILEKGIDA